MRISKKLTQTFPSQVAKKISEVAADFKIKSFSLDTVPTSKKFYVGEGERFYGIYANGRSASFEVVSANTIGASGLSHRIGEQFQMPAGTYLIRIHYYTKYFMDVFCIAPEMINE